MGGSFNPIHNAHLILAECSYEQFDLDKIYFMPSKNPPHKLDKALASPQHRSNMIKQAISNNPNFEFSDFELIRQGTTYTAETLELLKEKYKDTDFYFILGEDSLLSIEKWRNPQVIFDLAYIIIGPRKTCNKENIYRHIDHLEDKFKAPKILVLDSPLFEISSNLIRNNIKKGKSIKYYVPKEVDQYIYKENLYMDGKIYESIWYSKEGL